MKSVGVPRIIAGVLVAALPLAVGCITYEEHIVFNADGSGSVTAQLVVRETQFDTTSAALRSLADRLRARLSRQNIEEELRKEGIAVREVTIERSDSGQIWRVAYDFSDLEAFRRVRGEGRDVSLTEYDNATLELNLAFSSGAEESGDGRGGDAEDTGSDAEVSVGSPQELEHLLRGLSATFVYDMPTRVVSAPRGRVSDNTATFHWRYDRNGLSVLRPQTMRIIFRKDALVWPTFEALPAEGDASSGDVEMWDAD